MARIMVIDDEPDVRNLIESIVRNEGHEVLTAPDAAGAWKILEEDPDSKKLQVLLVDIDMPGESGVEFVLRLREHPRWHDIPVVFVTAYRERARPLVASGAGLVDIVDKPFRIEALQSKLGEMLQVAAARPN